MVLLVPELAFVTGLPDKRRDSRMVKEVMRELHQSPRQHCQRLAVLLRRIRESPEALQELSRWGLRLEPGIHRTQGRILPSERISLRHCSFTPSEELIWSKEVTREASISTIPMSHWLLVYPRKLQDLARDLVITMESMCSPLGMQVSKPILVELKDDRIETYAKSIRSFLNTQDRVQLLLCLISGNREDLYAAIKKLCCLHAPVPSQVINALSLGTQLNKMRAVVHKVLLQINCKLGGELWGVDIPLVRRGGRENQPSWLEALSAAGCKFLGVVFQMPHQEIADSLQLLLLDALQRFHEVNHLLPQKIVLYRDGVADSQLDTVLKYEIPQLQKCFGSFHSYQPSMVVMVVQKKISTKFYTLLGEQVGSPLPGTVVDHTITSSEWQDFFLLAHHSRQGCSNPTRYVCLLNTTSLSWENLQRLTFKLCHLYWNWPGTIRVPALCKYAHKLA
ncbi:Piwi-like 2, partial [Dryobates pubescens]